MGLDVYLYRCADRKAAREAEEAAEKECERVWEEVGGGKGYNELTQDQKDTANTREAEIRARYGIKDYRHTSAEKIEINSSKYPDHTSKIGYFRSSYNSGGINSFLRRMGLPDLYQIFNYSSEEVSEFYPDWAQAKARAIATLDLLRKQEPYDVMEINMLGMAINPRDVPKNEEEARAVFLTHLAKRRLEGDAFGNAYSNKEGHFFLDGIKSFAFIPGKTDFLGREAPCMYVAVERTDQGYYEKSLEIVIETCDYVLAQEHPEQFYMHWSG